MSRPAPRFITAKRLSGKRIAACAYHSDRGFVLVFEDDKYTHVVNDMFERLINEPLPYARDCKTAAEFNSMLREEGFTISGKLPAD